MQLGRFSTGKHSNSLIHEGANDNKNISHTPTTAPKRLNQAAATSTRDSSSPQQDDQPEQQDNRRNHGGAKSGLGGGIGIRGATAAAGRRGSGGQRGARVADGMVFLVRCAADADAVKKEDLS